MKEMLSLTIVSAVFLLELIIYKLSLFSSYAFLLGQKWAYLLNEGRGCFITLGKTF